jgi:hypothetical protein
MLTSTPRFAVRKNLRMTESSSNRMVVLLAMRDITYRRLPRHLWAHPVVATMLGVNPEILAFTQAYLEYRRHAGPWTGGELRLTEDGHHARVWDSSTDYPLDLISLPSASDEVRLTHLLNEGVQRSCRITKPLLRRMELIIARACATTWAGLEEALVSRDTPETDSGRPEGITAA